MSLSKPHPTFKSRDNAAPSPSTIAVRTYSLDLKERIMHSYRQGETTRSVPDTFKVSRGHQQTHVRLLALPALRGLFAGFGPTVLFLARLEVRFCSSAHSETHFWVISKITMQLFLFIRFVEPIPTLPTTTERRLCITAVINRSTSKVYLKRDDRRIW